MSFWRVIGVFLVTILLAATSVAISTLHGGTGDWTVAVRLPGNMKMQVRMMPLLKMATSPAGRRLLDGTAWQTRIGMLRFTDQEDGLLVACDDCSLHVPRFSKERLYLPHLYLQLERDGDNISGWVSNTEDDATLRIDFEGTLAEEALVLRWSLAQSELSDLLESVESAMPEVRRAVIQGRLSAHGTLELPSGRWTAAPQLEGFEVYGLGTEGLRYGDFDFICRDGRGIPARRAIGDGMPGWIPLRRMGALPRAVLAAEDSRFYRHPGYDMAELVPLLANAERPGRGASTITQQLAKNFFTGAEATASRKLRELLYAVEMERTLGKERILELYLNTVDWGPGLCGVADGSSAYFARRPAQLTLTEAAWMGGILRNPHRAYRAEYLGGRPDSERLEWVMSQLPGRQKHNLHTLRFSPPLQEDSPHIVKARLPGR